jgi:hypothetical protein
VQSASILTGHTLIPSWTFLWTLSIIWKRSISQNGRGQSFVYHGCLIRRAIRYPKLTMRSRRKHPYNHSGSNEVTMRGEGAEQSLPPRLHTISRSSPPWVYTGSHAYSPHSSARPSCRPSSGSSWDHTFWTERGTSRVMILPHNLSNKDLFQVSRTILRRFHTSGPAYTRHYPAHDEPRFPSMRVRCSQSPSPGRKQHWH